MKEFQNILSDIALGKGDIGKNDSHLSGLRDQLLVYVLDTYYEEIVQELEMKNLPVPKKQYILIHMN